MRPWSATSEACRLGAIVIVFLGYSSTTPAAEVSGSLSVSIDEFCRLSPADREALVAASLDRRLEHVKNLRYESISRMQNHEYRDGIVGKAVTPMFTSRYEHRRLGDSYRTEVDRGSGSTLDPRHVLVTGYDSKSGQTRSTVSVANSKDFGRIDTQHDPWTMDDRYVYWLDGQHTLVGEYLIRSLVEQKGHYQIDAPVDGGKVRLTVPWKPIASDRPIGTKELTLDPRRGFLPVRGKSHWERTTAEGQKRWREEEFVVHESELANDVWMPVKLTESIRGFALGPNVVNVFETEVKFVEAGTVKPEDLEVPFKAGLKVVDAVKGTTYHMGEDGKPKGPEDSLMGARPMTSAELAKLASQRASERSGTRAAMVVMTNVGVFLLVVSFLVRRAALRRHKVPV
ncbi:hypothetical protein ACYOEI_32450 [Singulisphaera rosea]